MQCVIDLHRDAIMQGDTGLVKPTVTADGRYELRLRKEYDPGWFDRIELRYTKDGAVYRNRIDENNPLTLARLVQSPDITLVNAAAD